MPPKTGKWVRWCAALLATSLFLASRLEAFQDTIRVQVSDIVAPDDANLLSGDSNSLGPMVIVGTRNGAFSGKLLVSSGKPIHGLKAVPGDLLKDGHTIPAAAVRVRYGVGWKDRDSFRRPAGLDILLDSPPDRSSLVSVWVTVNVPRYAPAGTYAGTVSVCAGGGKLVVIPVELRVADWTLPDTGDYTAWLELVQSPDTLSVEYQVPLWSPKHWCLIERSLNLVGQAGSRVVYVPLICHTNLGNAESMVRWMPKPTPGKDGATGGPYDFDFSIMDQYLDAAEKHMGRPKIVVFNVWDVYQQDRVLAKGVPKVLIPGADADAGAALPGHSTGPAVTMMDPATGRAKTRILPRFSDPDGAALWKPLFAELHRRMARRGLEKAMFLGMFTDAAPSREEASALKQVSGGLPWVCHAHFDPSRRSKDAPRAGYRTIHENVVLTLNPAKGRTYGWREADLRATHFRGAELDRMTPSAARCLMEMQITGKQRGIGYVGGDVWRTIRDKRGQRVGIVTDRYPQSHWRIIEMRSCLLAPGPIGAVATSRYENVREGIQECEARISLERALTDQRLRDRLGEPLADRAQKLLDERQHALWKDKGLTDEEILSLGSTVHWWRDLKFNVQANKGKDGYRWFQSSGWQKRSEQLYRLAGEVERALAAK